MRAKVYKPPHYPVTNRPSVFLAGSIDMGAAVDWQKQVEEGLADLPIAIFNPRRDNWDSTWEQDITNDKFRDQVEWELDHIGMADLVMFYFDPEGKAPITLLELGLNVTRKCLVCCPEGFWRRGNVQVVCARYGIPLLDSIEDLVGRGREFFGKMG